MKRPSLLALAVAAPLALGGCNPNATWSKISAAVGQADNALAQLSQNSIPKACKIIGVAEGYFRKLEPKISADKIEIERQAEAAVAVICNNPPANVPQAMATLVDLWFLIQDATKT